MTRRFLQGYRRMTRASLSGRSVLAVLLLAAVPGIASAAAPAKELELQGPFKLKEPGDDFALNTETGGLAAINRSQGTAMLYLPEYFQGDESKAVGPVRIGGEPSSVVFKKHGSFAGFAVGCASDPHIHLLDAATFKAIGKINVEGGTSLLGTAEDDPYVYYARPSSNKRPSPDKLPTGNDPEELRKLMREVMLASMDTVGRANVKTMADEGVVWEEATVFAVSADGKHLYVRRNGSPKEILCVAVGPKSPAGIATQIVHRANLSARAVTADPGGQYVFLADEGRVYSPNLQRVVGTFQRVRPTEVAVFKTRPIVAGLRDGSLILYSYNSLEPKATLPLPGELLRSPGVSPTSRKVAVSPRKHLLADDRNGRLIFAHDDWVMILPLGDPDGEVLLQAKVRSPKQVVVDKSNEIALDLSDPRVKVELPVAVPGMSVVDGRLRWTPTDNQLGEHTIPLRLSADGKVSETAIDLEAVRPHASVPFLADDCCIGPEARLAAVWSGGTAQSSPDYRPGDSRPHLALVDLEENRLLAEPVLPGRLGAIEIDRRYVYTAAGRATSVEARSRKDLSVTTAAYLPNEEPIYAVHSVADKYLAVVTRYGETHRFSLPDLKACDPPADPAASQARSPYRRLRQSVPVPVRDLGPWVYFDGCVYDKATSGVCLISSPPSETSRFVLVLGPEPKPPGPAERPPNTDHPPITATAAGLAAAPLLWNRPSSETAEEPDPFEAFPPELPNFPEIPVPQIPTNEKRTVVLDTVPLAVTSLGTSSPYGEASSFKRLAPGQGDRPATSTDHGENRVGRPTVDLEARDLLSGKLREKLRLFCETVPYRADPRLAHRLRARGATVVVLYWEYSRQGADALMSRALMKSLTRDAQTDEALGGSTSVYSYTFKTPEAENLTPPGFQPVQSALAVSGSRRTTLSHGTVGPVAGAQFELIGPMVGLSIDAKTAEVTVDGPALARLASSRFEGGYLKVPAPRMHSNRSGFRSVSLEAYSTSAGGVFEEIVGRPAEGVPVLVPIRVGMKLGGKLAATLSYYVFLETPGAALDEAAANRRLREIEKGLQQVRQQIDTYEQALVEIRANIEELRRDAQAVGPSPALQLRLQVLRETLESTTEQLRKAKALLKTEEGP